MSETEKELTAEEVIELMDRADEAMRSTLCRMLTPQARREGGEEHREQLRKLLSVASPHHVRDVMLHRMSREKMYVGRSLSFMNSIVAKTETSRIGGRLTGWTLNDKQSAYDFVDLLRVRRPALFGPSRPLADLELTPRTVVKPVSGSSSLGCYLVFAEDHIVHVPDRRTFTGQAQWLKHAQSILRKRSGPNKDLWVTEELVMRDPENLQPAPDLKFYVFYGKLALVSEIQRYPEAKRDFWNARGERIDPPGTWDAELFEGEGFSPEHRKLVERISREIPYPFMRIDMLRGEDGLVFGEFTPRPGSSNRFLPAWDRHLGEMWSLAENRLEHDLLAGKDFSAYKVYINRKKQKRAEAKQAAQQ